MEREIISVYFNLDFCIALRLFVVYFLSEDERQKLTVTEGYSVSEMFGFVSSVKEIHKGFERLLLKHLQQML